MFSYSKFTQRDIPCSSEYELPISSDYKVFVNGIEVPVYTCRISAYPLNVEWHGHQRDYYQTEHASYVNLVSDESIEIRVETTLDFERIKLKPYSTGVKPNVNGKTITFTLDKNGGYVLFPDSYHHCLYIFNSKPIQAPKKEDVTYYFDKGIHYEGKIQLKDNESVYVDKDAYVFGCIFAENAKNIRIFGNGIFDDSSEERFSLHCYDVYCNGNIKFYDCENILIQGVGFTNSAIWCVNLFHCENVILDDIKVFGQWRYNTDGVDVVNSKDVLIKNSFIHSFDDTITIKGIERYKEYDCKNITTENCVLWCDWGRACEIGLETICKEYDGIVFKNCDILRPGVVALDIACGNYAEIHNVLYENIRIECEKCYTPEQYQATDDMVYEHKDETQKWNLFLIHNRQFNSVEWGFIAPPIEDKGEMAGVIHDVLVKDVCVYYDKDIERKDGKYDLTISTMSAFENKTHYNVTLENVCINGEKMTEENVYTEISDIKNFQIK